ncbi:NPCBM/NEW2 domain-containing protein [Clostridium cavendishii DSM 21758]|uniref:NPCBM/NEW2 domain-containing protein n=1 Tax=Clostridium cavendishii DSM 21758 TaxID=1121302 RepID=A0A1M6IRA6_9CLOT|nr:NPCBM/NEW2 domain-containing protein [Clostridium cavendishii]SHJ37036.1 NPCBM/NEW2 domain-containing protein [Clostridium cavendishii DSM 21758]
MSKKLKTLLATSLITSTLFCGAFVMTPPLSVKAAPPSTSSGVNAFTDLTYLSDINWDSANTTFPSLPTQKDKSVYSLPITLNGKTYAKGIGTHASSETIYTLGKNFTNFETDIGVDSEVGNNGSVIFQVFGDGIKLYDSGVMTGATTAKTVRLNVTGIKQLKLVVTDGGDGINNDHADWANARLYNTSTYLSDTDWDSASTTFPALPTQKDKSVYSQPITLNGKTYTKGIGTHTVSETIYDLSAQFSIFRSTIGVDSEVGNNGSVVFQVFGDNVKLYDSGVMTGATTAKPISVDVTGVKKLKLVVTDAGDGLNNDHADWANARVIN